MPRPSRASTAPTSSITSIRAGGAAQRAHDEATTIAHGVVGQETVGPAGFAMAIRTIPPMVEYGRLTARLAPEAWLVNFSNPVSVVSQAVHQHSDARIIGICDTPTETFEDAAHALGTAAGGVRVRLLRAQSPRLAARGDLPGRAADRPAVGRRRAAGRRLPLAAVRAGAAARDAAAAHRVSLLLLPARRRARPPAARRHQPRPGGGGADHAVLRRPGQGRGRSGACATSSTWRRATPATCSSRPARRRRA